MAVIQEKINSCFASKIQLLPEFGDLEPVLECYIENYVVSKTLIGDAVHLAYASYYGTEYLLTWNCNHLANANNKKHIRIINGLAWLANA